MKFQADAPKFLILISFLEHVQERERLCERERRRKRRKEEGRGEGKEGGREADNIRNSTAVKAKITTAMLKKY